MTSDPRDYKLDITGTDVGRAGEAGGAAPPVTGARPFLSVLFACCGVYQRVYRDATQQHYEGRCPKCRRPVRFAVGEGGTTARSFVAR